jgi:hypothetical protein
MSTEYTIWPLAKLKKLFTGVPMSCRLLTPMLLIPTLIAAQAATPDARTLGWQIRPDATTSDTTLSFVEMKPGWHVTTNQFAGIMYRPEMTGVGEYQANFAAHLFPGGEHPEGFGMIIGGRNLVGAEQSYTYFLIRSDGKYLIKSRKGSETVDITPWTSSAHVKVLPAGAAEGTTAFNTLSVNAGPREVKFLINGQEVARQPRSELPADGVVGMRINHMLNLHVSDFSVVRPGAR